MEIIKQYIVKTEYGLNLLVLTSADQYFQQVHHSLEYNGGGSAVWGKRTAEEAAKLINQ